MAWFKHIARALIIFLQCTISKARQQLTFSQCIFLLSHKFEVIGFSLSPRLVQPFCECIVRRLYMTDGLLSTATLVEYPSVVAPSSYSHNSVCVDPRNG